MQKNRMIRMLALVMLVLSGLLLAGCGTKNSRQESGEGQDTKQERLGTENGVDNGKDNRTEGEIDGGTAAKSVAQEDSGQFRMLCEEQWHCMSQGGYYYITEEMQELKKGLWGRHIMYMDFATKQEVYLCAEPGCKHIDEKCSAVLSEDSMDMVNEALIFVMKDRLYIVVKEYDGEDTMESSYTIGDEEEKKTPVVLYSMGLDGSGRKKEYTFDVDTMIEAKVMGDGENLYFITKTIVTSLKEDTKYGTASERKLVRLGVKDSRMETVCPLPEGDIRWGVLGVHGENIILVGTKYNGKLTLEEQMALDKEKLWEYENDSKEVIMSLNIRDGKTSEVYSVENDSDSLHCTALWEDSLYISWEKEKKVEKVDIKTGKVKKLAEGISMWIYGALPGVLYGDSWSDSEDHTTYFVDTDSGEVYHSELVNKKNGWEIEILGEWEGKVLAIYDYEGKEVEDGAWDITRNQFGLIDKEDLLKGRDAFEKIDMKEGGM